MPQSPDLRVRVPLWTKLGALFGGVYGVGVALFGLWDGWHRVAQEESHRRSEMEMLAQVVAAGIDARGHAELDTERDRARPAYAEAVRALRLAIDGSDYVTWGGTAARDRDGNWSYVVDASDSAPFPVGYPIFDGVVERDRAWAGEIRFVEGLVDDAGTWHTVFAPIRAADGAVIGVVELAGDADREWLVLRGEIRRAASLLTAVVLVGLWLAFVFGRLLSRHLAPLVAAAQAVSRGDLEARVTVSTRDEIGVLAASFNQMLDGLKERAFIRETFGRFVNPAVVSQLVDQRQPLRLGGEARVVTVVATDLRGFTALCDERGPEPLVTLLNRYLERMIGVVERYEGNVAELVGDGMIILFGAPEAHDDDPRRAVACAVEMQRELARFNAEVGERLRMGIGIDTGPVIAGHIGAERHLKYGVVGSPINLAARLESFTLGNQILISEATYDAAGLVEVDPILEIRAKGRRQPLRGYPVRAVGDVRMPEEAAAASVELQAFGTAYRVYGKWVDDEPINVELVRIESESVTIRSPDPMYGREDLKLSFAIDAAKLDEIYGTVSHTSEDLVTVRLTAVPSDVRGWIEGLLAERAAGATSAPRR